MGLRKSGIEPPCCSLPKRAPNHLDTSCIYNWYTYLILFYIACLPSEGEQGSIRMGGAIHHHGDDRLLVPLRYISFLITIAGCTRAAYRRGHLPRTKWYLTIPDTLLLTAMHCGYSNVYRVNILNQASCLICFKRLSLPDVATLLSVILYI